MSSESRQVLVAIFNRADKADMALQYLKDLRSEGKIDFQQAVVLKRERDGKLSVQEKGGAGTGKSAGIGGVMGGVLGLVAGPAGVVIGASTGAVIGGLVSHHDSVVHDERIMQLGERLEPGSSAVIAIVSDEHVGSVNRALQDEAVEVSARVLDEELLAKLEAGDEFAGKKVDIE
jgi:uncharacterized membrane protein